MKKIMRLSAFGLLFALAGGQTLAQEAPMPPGPETEIMESIDIAVGPESGPGFEMPMPPPGAGPMPFAMPMPPPGEGGMQPMIEGAIDILAMRGGGGGGMLGGVCPDQMSDEQLEKIYKAKEDFLDKAGPKMVEMRSQHRALKDAMMEPELNKSKIQGIQNKINSLMGDLASLKLEKEMATLEALTAEQRKEMRRAYLRRADFGSCGGGSSRMRQMWRRGGGGGHCPPGGECPKGGDKGGPGGGPKAQAESTPQG